MIIFPFILGVSSIVMWEFKPQSSLMSLPLLSPFLEGTSSQALSFLLDTNRWPRYFQNNQCLFLRFFPLPFLAHHFLRSDYTHWRHEHWDQNSLLKKPFNSSGRARLSSFSVRAEPIHYWPCSALFECPLPLSFQKVIDSRYKKDHISLFSKIYPVDLIHPLYSITSIVVRHYVMWRTLPVGSLDNYNSNNNKEALCESQKV